MDEQDARNQLTDLMALVDEQMGDLAAMEGKRTSLRAKASTAEGKVEVTVDARGQLSDINLDETYLDDFDFADLGDYIIGAARAASQEIERQVSGMYAPALERRKALRDLAGDNAAMPDLKDLMVNLGLPAGPFGSWADTAAGKE